MFRVILGLKEPLVLAGARAVIANSPDCSLCGSASRLEDLLLLLRDEQPDVVVLDKQFEHEQAGTIDGIHAEWPTMRIVVYVQHSAQECVLRSIAEESMYELSEEALESIDCCLVSLKAGARGCLPRGAEPEQLLTAIRSVMAGEIAAAPWLSAHFTRPRQRAGPPRLSNRQLEIVRLVARGFTNKGIARELGLREQTVKNHLARASRSLGTANRLEMAVFALQQKMFSDARSRRVPA